MVSIKKKPVFSEKERLLLSPDSHVGQQTLGRTEVLVREQANLVLVLTWFSEVLGKFLEPPTLSSSRLAVRSVDQSMRCSTSLTFRCEYRATDRVSLWPDTIMICALLNPFFATLVILVCLSW